MNVTGSKTTLFNRKGTTLVEVIIATLILGVLSVSALTAIKMLTGSVTQLEQQSATDQLMSTLQGQIQASSRYFAASTNLVGSSIDVDGVTDLEVNHAMKAPGMPFDDDGFCPDPNDCPDKERMKGEVKMYMMQSAIPGLVDAELRYTNPAAFQGTRSMVFLTTY